MTFRNRAAAYASASFILSLALSATSSAQHYNRVDLTADQSSISAAHVVVDPNLVNSWGLARSSSSAWWVSDNHAGLSTLYDGTGNAQPLVVTVPPPKDVTSASAPTGITFNPTTSFQVAPDQPAIFLFATEDGTISGWNPRVNPTVAVRMVNQPGKAVYKGLAIAKKDERAFLYATNFVTGRVDVFDGKFHRIHTTDDAFRNPNLQDEDRWSAFGIQNVGGNIVVTYARRKPGETDEEHGAGLGRVAIFDTDGRFLSELQRGSWMNIHAFNTFTGKHEGQILNPDGSPLTIDSLWALSFGSGTTGLFNELFFTSGPNDENDGLFGKVTVVSTEQKGNTE